MRLVASCPEICHLVDVLFVIVTVWEPLFSHLNPVWPGVHEHIQDPEGLGDIFILNC